MPVSVCYWKTTTPQIHDAQVFPVLVDWRYSHEKDYLLFYAIPVAEYSGLLKVPPMIWVFAWYPLPTTNIIVCCCSCLLPKTSCKYNSQLSLMPGLVYCSESSQIYFTRYSGSIHHWQQKKYLEIWQENKSCMAWLKMLCNILQA